MPAPAHDSELAHMRILVAEDNPVNQIVIERMLQRLGCSADLVSNGIDVLRQVQAAQYDLVLMDIQMPGIDGLEASRRIRSLSPVHSRIPIVAMTASATVEDRGACVAAGMNDYLTKPLALDALRKVLEQWGPSRNAAGTGRERRVTDSSLAAIAD
jgi:CheY-like chemotaxis protein